MDCTYSSKRSIQFSFMSYIYIYIYLFIHFSQAIRRVVARDQISSEEAKRRLNAQIKSRPISIC
jgi:dephospho-CoA kinase